MNNNDFDKSDPEQLKLLSVLETSKSFLFNQKLSEVGNIESLQRKSNRL